MMDLRFLKNAAGSNLRNKLLLLFIVLATVPILALGGVSLYLVDLAHSRDVSNLELQLIGQKIEETEKFLADTLGILDIRLGTEQKLDIALSGQQFFLEGLLEENGAFEEVSFLNLSGKETARRIRGLGDAESLVSHEGNPKFELPRRGELYIGNVYYTLKGPFVTLGAPVRNRNDVIVQTISAEVNLSSLARSFETAALGFSGRLVLVDGNGSLIAYGGQSDIPIGADLSSLSRVARVLSGEALTGLESEDRYESSLSGTPVVGAGKKIPRVGWAVLAEWPLADADAVVNDVRNQLILFSFVAIVAVMFLAPLFAGRILVPIRKLADGAEAIEKGDFGKRVSVSTSDELQDLAEAFNRMAVGLKRLQELKNEFVFIAAHELRSPVTAIRGYLSMIGEGSAGTVPEKLQEFLRPVGRAGEQLTNLVNDLLEIARSDAGRIEIEVVSLPLDAVIGTVLTEMRPLAEEKNISLRYDAPQPSIPILADANKLREVVTNFVSNAIKYNKEGGLVTITHEEKPGSVVTHVADNGFGISEESQKHIFEKFYREKREEAREIQGTGLGLFITKELIEKMGGAAWFASREGEGTTFSFELKRPQQAVRK